MRRVRTGCALALLASLPLWLHGHVEITFQTGLGPAPIRRPTASLTYFINNQTAAFPNIEAGSNPIAAIDAAFARIGAASGITMTNGGTTGITGVAPDGANVVSFANTSANAALTMGAAAATVVQVNLNTLAITEADIVFNPTLPWSTLGTATRQDIEAVCTHEVGHAVGQDHSPIVNATMYPFIFQGSTVARTLSEDDLAGLRTLYPQGQAASFGTVTGIVQRTTGQPVFGAHVVLKCATTGRARTGAVSFLNGAYRIESVPPGLYEMYVEPLDGPFPSGALGLGIFGMGTIDASFRTTWLGGSAAPTRFAVLAGQTVSQPTIAVSPSPTVNITGGGTSPTTAFSLVGGLPAPVSAPFNGFVAVSGPSVQTFPDSAFSIGGPFVSITGPSVGAGVLANGEGWKAFPFSVTTNAPEGGYVIRVRHNGQDSMLTGLLDVQRTAPAAYTAVYGPSCLGSAGALALSAPLPPTVGNGGFALRLQGTLPGETAFFLVASAPAWIVPLPGCVVGVDLGSLFAPFPGYAVASVSGTTQLLTPIPNDPSLAGLDVYAQALSTDSLAPTGFVLSNPLAIHIE